MTSSTTNAAARYTAGRAKYDTAERSSTPGAASMCTAFAANQTIGSAGRDLLQHVLHAAARSPEVDGRDGAARARRRRRPVRVGGEQVEVDTDRHHLDRHVYCAATVRRGRSSTTPRPRRTRPGRAATAHFAVQFRTQRDESRCSTRDETGDERLDHARRRTSMSSGTWVVPAPDRPDSTPQPSARSAPGEPEGDEQVAVARGRCRRSRRRRRTVPRSRVAWSPAAMDRTRRQGRRDGGETGSRGIAVPSCRSAPDPDVERRAVARR